MSHETALRSARVIAKMHEVNPIRAYLESLPASEGAIDRLCADALGLEEELHRTYVRRWLVAAVRRALTPGCQADSILTFLGRPGIGKTSFARALFGAEWLSESLPDATDPKKAGEVMHGKWCVELAELEALFRADRNAFTAFATRTSDRYREAYARGNAKDHPRACVLFGTTNEHEIYEDVHGADRRRIWILPVETIDAAWVAANRDGVWSEAYALAAAGEPHWLTEPEEALHVQSAEAYIVRDTWEAPIRAYLKGKREIPNLDGVLRCSGLGLEVGRTGKRERNRAARVLKALGCENQTRRVDGKKERYWAVPDDIAGPPPAAPLLSLAR